MAPQAESDRVPARRAGTEWFADKRKSGTRRPADGGLVIRGLHRRFGAVPVLTGLDLEVPEGTVAAVLGPSGCGKTTLLRIVAGFLRADAGTVLVGGRVVAGPKADMPPEHRHVGVVPQEGALFPHLSVAGNVGYGLDRAGRRSGRVEELLALVGLDGHGPRMPQELSGGQQQRVALARALAPRPALVLLDEPFSALDAGLRAEVRADVREALDADGATAVLVTHDQGEALSIADRVAVMQDGRVVQCDTSQALYRAPASLEVARFLGEAVVLDAVVDGNVAETVLGRLPVAAPGGDRVGPAAGGPVQVMIRPEQIAVRTGSEPTAGTVVRTAFHGHDALLAVRLDAGVEITARVLAGGEIPEPGQRVTVAVHGPVRAFPRD